MEFFYLLHDFVYVKSCKENLRLISYFAVAQLRQNLSGGVWHEGFQQYGTCLDAFQQVVKHRLQAVFFRLVFRQRPWHGLVYIFVAAFEQIENLCDGIRYP